MPVVEKNRDYVVDIKDMTHEGQGVGRIDGLAVFTDGVLAGEQVELKIIKLKKSYAVGKLLKVLRPSPDRVDPFCGVFRRCGGCSLQHMDYNAQLAFKTKLVRDSLERIGGLKDVKVRDTIGMKQPYNFRNKAQYPVTSADGKIVTGFYAPRSHEVIGSDECRIQNMESDRVRKLVAGFMMEKGIPAYDENTGKGLVRHIMTRVGFNTGEIMVVLVINGDTLPHAGELAQRLVDETAQSSGSSMVKSVYLNVNTDNTNVILGDRNILVYGNESITEKIGNYSFMISPGSFFQVNTAQTEVLYSKVLEFAGLNGSETVFDLYCGIGTISLFLSSRAKIVYGVEVVKAAVKDARRNAKLNGVDNVEFIEGEAEKAVPDLYRKGIHADVVVLDPPRKGCDESLLQLIAADMQPDRIVYVSCNPATLARDLKYLDAQGYEALEAQPVDLFPWTGHVECVTLMTNVKNK